MPATAARGASAEHASKRAATAGQSPQQTYSFWRGQGKTHDQAKFEVARDHGWDTAHTLHDPDQPEPAQQPSSSSSTKPSKSSSGGSRSGSSSGRSSQRSTPSSSFVSMPGTPAGVLLAVLLYPAVVVTLQKGPAGLKTWFYAKFLNKTTGATGERTAWDASLLTGQGPAASAALYDSSSSASTGTPVTAIYNTGTTGAGAAAGSGGSATARAAVTAALSQVGVKYVLGGETPGVEFDCSGLVQWSYAQAGVTLPRTTAGQITAGRSVSPKALLPGDIVFPTTGHVQMYIGNGQIVSAPHPGENVHVIPIGTVIVARRIA